jgi:3-oxocholest-4-en-26-oate---CoA ligase
VSGVVGLNLATAWEAITDTIGDEQALICGDTIRTWHEFDDRAARISAALSAAGIAAGDNVGLCLFNGNEYSEAQFGAMKVRASPFNINYRYTAEELRSLLDDADARAVFFSADLRDRFADIAATLPEVRCWIEVGADHDDEAAPFARSYEELIAGTRARCSDRALR